MPALAAAYRVSQPTREDRMGCKLHQKLRAKGPAHPVLHESLGEWRAWRWIAHHQVPHAPVEQGGLHGEVLTNIHVGSRHDVQGMCKPQSR